MPPIDDHTIPEHATGAPVGRGNRAVELDRNGIELLDRGECLRRLGSVPIGRLGLSVDALPVVVPVNFVLAAPPGTESPVVVVRSANGSKLAAAQERSVVAFEIDGYDPFGHTGWSVLVQGVTRVLEGDDRDWAERLPLAPWAIPDASSFIALDTDVVQGRRFGIGPQPFVGRSPLG